VISGTGSIVCSWQDGKTVKSGGRGPLLGDPGSASQIGKRLLNDYLATPESASPPVKAFLLDLFGSTEEREIILRLYGSSSPAATLGNMGKLAATEALGGSESALEIVRTEMDALAKLLLRHAGEHAGSRTSLRVGLAGGLWKTSPLYKQEFESALACGNPTMKFQLFILKRPPVEGAAQLAREGSIGN
jgi:N-acetylglucosamine kinase-like BadF-type ATPase